MRLSILLFMLLKSFSGTSQNEPYKVGQIWEYHTRKGEEKSTLIIVGVEEHKNEGTIINIYVQGLKIKNPKSDRKFIDKVQHLPFSKEAMDKSVTRLISITKKLPDYKKGYDEWRGAFDNGKAGVFSITIKESIDFMEKTLNQ